MSASASAAALPDSSEIHTRDHEVEDEQVEEEQTESSDTEADENDMSQVTIDKYATKINLALQVSDVATVERLCRLPCIRSYTPYHLTQLEHLLSWGDIQGEAQERCWQAMSTAWPESIDAHLHDLLRAAVQAGPLSALITLIQKVRQRSNDEGYVHGEERKALFQAEMKKPWIES